MNERRERMSSCQRGKSLAWHDGTKDDSQKFLVWLAKNCPKIPERTAYRFMEIAEKVLLHLGIAAMEGMRVSEMLTDLGSPASASILGYISGKTMRACLAGVVIEGDETTRLVRAQNGKHKGGTNAHDNRRDYPKFIIRHFKSISTIQAKWARIIAKHPGEHAKMMQALRAIILGGPVRLVDGGRLIDQDPWDKDFTRAIRDLANERLRED
ncbi:MAG TPA: hypothetical protein VH595_05980 [Verrucomicrobiae bacterium]|nr:hypothetical protein [Verrucomicrobiae bacterium]